MTVALTGLENPQALEVAVSGPGDANRLFIYTGIAVFDFKGTGGDWRHDTLTFQVGRAFTTAQFKGAAATASLASILNMGTAVNAGWAVDKVEARRAGSGKTEMTMHLAVRDSDGYLFRLGYEVNVLAKI